MKKKFNRLVDYITRLVIKFNKCKEQKKIDEIRKDLQIAKKELNKL